MDRNELLKVVKGNKKLTDYGLVKNIGDENERGLLVKSGLNEDRVYKYVGKEEYNRFGYMYIDRELGIYVELYSLEKEILEAIRTQDAIKQFISRHAELVKNAEYETLYMLMNSNWKYDDFEYRHREIPMEQRKEIFRDIYTSMEYGFEDIDKDFVKEYLTKNRKADERDSSDVDLGEEVVIYRGEGEKSSALQVAHSWTTDINVAYFFAAKNGGYNSSIWEGKIRKGKIRSCIDERNEKEVICDYKDVYDLKLLYMGENSKEEVYEKLYTIDEEMVNSLARVRKSWYRVSDLHGIAHTKRVLALGLLLMNELGIKGIQREIVKQSILLHDIGRVNDIEDARHGVLSVEKARKMKLNPMKLRKEEVKISEMIMAKHCVDDSKYTDERTRNLYNIVKDADALDRVRLGIRELDINYLRYEESKELLFLAFIFWSGKLDGRYNMEEIEKFNK